MGEVKEPAAAPVHSSREPLTPHELQTLAIYNSECERGILHTSQWIWRMIELQERLDRYGVAG